MAEMSGISSLNVLVIGESGTGKTAVINMIYGETPAKTSSSATGCTVRCESFYRSPKDYPNLHLRMIDTIGLGESLEGSVPTDDAIEMLEEKLAQLYDHDGIHLILFCIRKGRQNEATTRNYQGIVEELCGGKVPCLLVITRCEDDEPLGEWWKNNQSILRKRLGLNVIDAVSVTTVSRPATAPIYEESRQKLIEAIVKHALQEPWKSEDFDINVRNVFRKHIKESTTLRPELSDWQKYLQRPMNSSSSTPKKSSFQSWITSLFS